MSKRKAKEVQVVERNEIEPMPGDKDEARNLVVETQADRQVAEGLLRETGARLPEAGIENIKPKPELVSKYRDSIQNLDIPTNNEQKYGDYHSEEGLSLDELRRKIGIKDGDHYSDESIALEQAIEDLYLSGEIIPSRTGGRGGGDWKYQRVENPVSVSQERFEEVKRAVSNVLLENTDEYANSRENTRALTKDELKNHTGRKVDDLNEAEFLRVLHELVMGAKIDWSGDRSRWFVRNAELVRATSSGLDDEQKQQVRLEGRVRSIAGKLESAFLSEGWSVAECAGYLDELPPSIAQNPDFWLRLSEHAARNIAQIDRFAKDEKQKEHFSDSEVGQILKSEVFGDEILLRLKDAAKEVSDIEGYEKIAKAYTRIIGAKISHRLFEQGLAKDSEELKQVLSIPDDLNFNEKLEMLEDKLAERMKHEVEEVLASIPQEDRSNKRFWANFDLPNRLTADFESPLHNDAMRKALENIIVENNTLVPSSLREDVSFWMTMSSGGGFDTFRFSNRLLENTLVNRPDSTGIPKKVLDSVDFWVTVLQPRIHRVRVIRGKDRNPNDEEVRKQIASEELESFAWKTNHGEAFDEAKKRLIMQHQKSGSR